MTNKPGHVLFNPTVVAAVAAAVVVSLWIATWVVLKDLSTTDRGTFGDMFGGTNALFSGLAFVGLTYAILLQRQELALQREEVALTRIEMSGQREALEKQNAALETQSHEGTLFQMLALLNQLVLGMDVRDQNGTEQRGRDCFAVFVRKLEGYVTRFDDVDDAVIRFSHEEGAELWPYARMVITIITFVRTSTPEGKHKFYLSVLKSMLSGKETVILLYLLHASNDAAVVEAVEQYRLFQGLNRDECIRPEHYDLYRHSAYGG